MLKKIIKYILIIIFFIYLSYFYSNKKEIINELKGQDKAMYVPYNLRYTNINFTYFKAKNNINFNLIKKKLYYNLENYSNDIRYCLTDDNLSYYKSTLHSSFILNIILKKLNNLPTKDFMTKHILKYNFGINFYVVKNYLIIVQNHIILDGLTGMTLSNIIFDNDWCDFKLISKFKYTPILTELYIIPKLYKILTKIPKRFLSYDLPYKETKKCYQGNNRGLIEDIKKIKKKIENIKNKKINFSYLISSIVIKNIFNNLNKNKNKLTLGIIFAFNSEFRFNNFSLASIILTKPKNWDTLDDFNKINLIFNEINESMINYGKQQILLNYLVTNVYNFNIYCNDYIDILIANLPPTMPIIDNQKIILNKVDLEYISFPMYCNIGTTFDEYCISYTSRTHDINNYKLFNDKLIN